MDIHKINELADAWVFWVSHAAIQATVVTLLALVAIRFAPRLPANLKYVILLLAMVKFMIPPFIASPSGVFSLISLTDSEPRPVPTEQLSPVVRNTTEPQQSNSTATYLTPIQPSESVFDAHVIASAPAPATPKAVKVNAVQSSKLVSDALPVAAWLKANWAAWLMLCWMIGVTCLLSRMANGIKCLRRIVKHCEPATGDGERRFNTLAHSMGVGRVQLLLSPQPVTPLACGLLHPSVVVPKSLVEQFTVDEQRAIFAHELAHHRRRDPLILWLQGFFLALWWFHPLAWLLNRNIVRVREQCCDDLVISERLASRKTYATALVRAVEWCSMRSRFLEFAAPQMHPLRHRISSLLDPLTSRSSRLSRWNWVVVAMISLVILPGFGTPDQQVLATRPAPLLDNDPTTKAGENSKLCKVGGRILDEQGRPIRATVWLHSSSSIHAKFKQTETDADGRYQFNSIDPGFVTVAALGDGFSHTGTVFRLQKGRTETKLNLVATKPKTLKLTIIDEHGTLISGVKLRGIQWQTPSRKLFGLNPALIESQGMEVPESDTDGVLSIPRLPENATCKVSLDHPDYVGKIVDKIDINQQVTVSLEKGVPIIVRAVNAETSQPLTDATVDISWASGISESGAPVAEDGTYRTRLPVNPQHVSIKMTHPELATDRRVSLDGGTASGDFEFRFYRQGIVRGRVVDEATGQPAAGVRVSLTKQRNRVGYAVSDVEGQFEIKSPKGYFHLTIGGGNGFYGGTYTKPATGKPRPGEFKLPGQALSRALPRDVNVKPDETVVVPGLVVNKFPKLRGVLHTGWQTCARDDRVGT